MGGGGVGAGGAHLLCLMLVNMHATEATNTQTPSMNRPPACPSEHVKQSEQSVLPPSAQSIVSHSPSWAQAQELS